MRVIHREPTSKIALDHVTGYCRIWGCTHIREYPHFYITRQVSYLLEPYVQLNTVSSYILVTYSLTIPDLPLSLPPPAKSILTHLSLPLEYNSSPLLHSRD
jgi:hypothetical protein